MSILNKVERVCLEVGFEINANDLEIFDIDLAEWDKKFNYFLGVSGNYFLSLSTLENELYVYLQREAEIIIADKDRKGSIIPIDDVIIPDDFINELHEYNMNRKGIFIKID